METIHVYEGVGLIATTTIKNPKTLVRAFGELMEDITTFEPGDPPCLNGTHLPALLWCFYGLLNRGPGLSRPEDSPQGLTEDRLIGEWRFFPNGELEGSIVRTEAQSQFPGNPSWN